MSYTTMNDWAKVPSNPMSRQNGRTHGVCVTKAGNVMVFHQAENGLVTFDADGKVINATGGYRWVGAHGMTLIEENGEEFLWLVDQTTREVVKTTLDGTTVLNIEKPDHPIYAEQHYTPTWAAQNPRNGDVWVGDGYGSHLVHRYDHAGTYISSIDGTEHGRGEAGQLREPHGLNFRLDSAGNPELWVTDRANHRIQVFDGEGTFIRDSGVCHSPCCFDFHANTVVIPELFTGAKVIDVDSFELIAEIGASDRVSPNEDPQAWWPPQAPKGWPNLAGTEHVRDGVFNSPHGGCFDANGNIFIVEWIVGGRITKLVHNG